MVRTTSSILLALCSFTAACGLLGGGSDDGDPGCQPGTELCECLDGVVCSGDLACIGGFCVVPGSTSGPAGTSSPDTAGTVDPDGDSGSDGGGETGGTEDGGPVIVDFGTNVTAITEGETVTFTATVIDPDGPDDIQGGSLKNSDASITYGAFTDTGDGTYTMSLSWAAIDQAQTISFDGVGVYTFRAEFFDNDGKLAWRTADIDLTCPGGCAREGSCPDVDDDPEHCGVCDNACPITGPAGGCAAGACLPTLGPCNVPQANAPTCDEVCGLTGQVCVEGACDGGTVFLFPSLGTCTDYSLGPVYGSCDVQYADFDIFHYRCCCQ